MILSAMSVISPYGVGTRAFTDGIRAGAVAVTPKSIEDDLPHTGTGLVPEADLAPLTAAAKGKRTLGRGGGLAVGAVGLMLGEHDLADVPSGKRGLVLGGDLVTTDRAMAIMRDSLTSSAPYHINAKEFPGSVMNHAAAQCAIRFDFKGPNATVTAGRVTGLAVFNYARRLHRAGRASTLLVGAVEDFNERRAWLTWHGHGEQASDPLGEGACVFLAESAQSAREHGRTPLAEVLALEFASARQSESQTDVLSRAIRRALDRAGLAPSDVRACALSGVDGDPEHQAVTATIGTHPRLLHPARLIGDTDGAAAVFQLAAAIATADGGEVALVTATDPDGQVGCGLFRVLPA